MTQNCTKCGASFEILEQEIQLYEKVAPTIEGKAYKFPLPELCPDCRAQKRSAFRNEMMLYTRKCDLCNTNIVSVYDEDSKFKVYCHECFWSDKWNALNFGAPFDFSKTFNEQFKDLMAKVPRLYLVNRQCENSEYANYSFENKNGYILIGCHYEEDCMYGRYSTKNKDCIDYFWLYGCELTYECTFSKKCFRSAYLDYSQECSECYFGYDLHNCHHCLFCFNLRNKEYCIFNKQFTKEEYEKYLADLHLNSYTNFAKICYEWAEYKKTNAIFRASYQVNCENCEGTNHQNSKNLGYSFSCTDCEDCMYGFQMDATYNSIDNNQTGYDRCDNCYNCIGINGIFHCFNCDSCWQDAETLYSNICFSCTNCFGCIGLRNNKYCILNKQYTKEEYEKLVPEIISHMEKSNEWGKFFDNSVYPFAYNETIAHEEYPLSKDEALALGFTWKDKHNKDYQPQTFVIPDDISTTDTSIQGQILACMDCGKNYKIIEQEFNFYKKINLPIPRQCPTCRHLRRIKIRTPQKLWERECFSCKKSLKSSYDPSRSEKIYCDECYNKEVY
jgi:hypothetical protein